MKTLLCCRTLLFLLSSSVNHLVIPQIFLLTVWRGPIPRLGASGLNYQTTELYIKWLKVAPS